MIRLGNVETIIVIQSLPKQESQTGSDLYNDIIIRNIERLRGITPIRYSFFYNTTSKVNLLEILNYIGQNASYFEGGLVIHFEMHGSSNKDGLILSDRSLVLWIDLVARLRKINIATHNNLYITMATCYGRYLFEGVEPNLKSPYVGYVSASKEVSVEEIIESFSEVYSNLIITGNVINAYLRATTKDASFFYKDSFTTFKQLMELTRNRIDYDSTYRAEILNNPLLIEGKQKGYVDDDLLKEFIEQAFINIYQNHKKAFDFYE